MQDTHQSDDESADTGRIGVAELTRTIRDAGFDPEQLSPEELGLVREIVNEASGLQGDSSRTRPDASSDDRDSTRSTDEDQLPGEGGAATGPRTNGSLPDPGNSTLEPADLPKITRLTAGAMQELTKRSVKTYTRTSTRFLRAMTDANSPVELLDESQEIVRDEAQRLGLDGRQRGQQGRDRERDTERRRQGGTDRDQDPDSLLERGTRLLAQSADVTTTESTHPAYSRILDELAMDEARILRLLATEGAQPVVDVYDSGWLPGISELVAARLSMLDSEAGCRADANTSAYLNNLQRLGLLTISDEPVADLTRYQVLQAQPEVEAAMEEASRGSLRRRKAHLTPFGVDFCRTCLPVSVDAEQAAGASQPTADLDE
jgi:hypothetical protein